jgi:hypothetical protein
MSLKTHILTASEFQRELRSDAPGTQSRLSHRKHTLMYLFAGDVDEAPMFRVQIFSKLFINHGLPVFNRACETAAALRCSGYRFRCSGYSPPMFRVQISDAPGTPVLSKWFHVSPCGRRRSLSLCKM